MELLSQILSETAVKNMSKRKKIIFIIVAVIVVGFIFGPPCIFLGSMAYQQRKGCRYLDSITEKDIPVWIERTETYLDEYAPLLDDQYGSGIYLLDPIPKELKELGIVRVDILKNCINYVWLGGMDHTYLTVSKNEQGQYIITAGYNDYNSKVIWPKINKSEHSVE